MKTILLLFIPIILFTSCFDTTEGDNTEETCVDYGEIVEPWCMDLQTYDSITAIVYLDNQYYDYDSLTCTYSVRVRIIDPDWVVKHDSLHVQCVEYDIGEDWMDYRFDYAFLNGKRKGDTEWVMICGKGLGTVYPGYYSMRGLLEAIGCEIESRHYYFDSVDWVNNHEYYESDYKRKYGCNIIRGEIRIIRPSMSL